MKKILFSTVFLCWCFSAATAQSIKLPNECKNILDKNFRGWKTAEIRGEINEYHRKKHLKYSPNLIKGDWNGDGKTEYAILIEQGKSKNFQGEVAENRRLLIIFVKNQSGYKYFRFDGADSISLMRKGSTDYSYETDKKFRYKTDAVFSGFWEKGGDSYVWRRGKFIRITTSD